MVLRSIGTSILWLRAAENTGLDTAQDWVTMASFRRPQFALRFQISSYFKAGSSFTARNPRLIEEVTLA